MVRGESLPTVAGRGDDFAWPPSQRGNQTFVSPQTAAVVDETATDGAAEAEAVEAN
ncbi:MAG: hypothetical protein J0H08_01320 [Rhizobiales bacterium]|nr:hypothetical protein [Hyphomicrobiales bacterium]